MKIIHIFGLIGLVCIFISQAFAEEFTMSTYYPAPFGVYREFTTTYNTYLARDGGRVGIGTTDPGGKLHLVDEALYSGAYITELRIGSQGSQIINFNDRDDGSTYGYAGNYNRLELNVEPHPTTGIEDLYLSAVGGGNADRILLITDRVGIGTVSPGAMLDVNGSIQARQTSYIPMQCRAIPAEDPDPQPTCNVGEWQLAAWCSGNCDGDDARVTICCSR